MITQSFKQMLMATAFAAVLAAPAFAQTEPPQPPPAAEHQHQTTTQADPSAATPAAPSPTTTEGDVGDPAYDAAQDLDGAATTMAQDDAPDVSAPETPVGEAGATQYGDAASDAPAVGAETGVAQSPDASPANPTESHTGVAQSPAPQPDYAAQPDATMPAASPQQPMSDASMTPMNIGWDGYLDDAPPEIEQVVESGEYTTEDLNAAMLRAMERMTSAI